jgi:hypothetical protein
MKLPRIFILIICFPVQVAAQHLAPATDNFNTSHSMLYQPASTADPIPYANIRIAGLSALFQNSYLYFPNASFSERIGSGQAEAGSNQHLYLEADVYGPALTFAREFSSFGFFTRGRAAVLGRNVTPEFVNFSLNGLNYPPQHYKDFQAENTTIKHLGWGEIGVNYAQMIKREGDRIVTLGGNLKLLSAFSHVTIRIEDMKYMVDTANVTIRTTASTFALSVPQANLGMGAGIDLGIQFKKLLSDDNDFHVPHSVKRRCEVKDYKYKLGISVLDLGFLPIKKNTTSFKFGGDSLFFADYEGNKVSGITPLTQLLQKISNESGASPEVKNKIIAFLPLTLSTQFDYNFENHFYANASLMAGIRMPWFYGAERMSSLTLSGRYERRRLCVAIPLTLYRFGPPAIGLYARLGPLQIGSNRPIPFILRRDTYGVDAYASLTIPLYQSRPCKELMARKKKYCPPGKKTKLVIFKEWKKQRDKRKKDKQLEKDESL